MDKVREVTDKGWILQVVKEVLSEQWPEVTDNWRESLGEQDPARAMHRFPHPGAPGKDNIAPGPVSETHIWCRAGKAGPCEEKVIRGGWRNGRGRKHSTGK